MESQKVIYIKEHIHIMKKISLLLLLLFSAALIAAETLNADFSTGKAVETDGKVIVPAAATVDGFRMLGKDAFTINCEKMLGESGTVIAKIKLDKPAGSNSKRYSMITIRGKGRLICGIDVANQTRNLYFSYTDMVKSHYFNKPAALEYGKEHYVALSYGEGIFRCYLDGVLINEVKQPTPMVAPNRLRIGEFKDGWYVRKPAEANGWGIANLKVYDHVLTPLEVAESCGKKKINFRDEFRDLLTVPQVIGKVPALDGELNETIWQYAASLLTVRHAINPENTAKLPPHRMLAAYDRDNLYIGIETIFPPRAIILGGDTRTADREPEVFGSESFEFYILVNGIRYRFGGNYAGGSTESRPDNGSWNGTWSYKTSNKMRIDDTVLWQGEVVIPWKTLGLDAPPAGDLPFNFCRSWYLDEVSTHSSLTDSGYGKIEEYGTMHFTGKTPVMRLISQTDPNEGNYQQELQFLSVDGGKVNYSVEMIRRDGTAAPVPVANREISLAPAKITAITLPMNIENPGYDTLLFRFSAGKKLLLQQTIPFKLNDRLFDINCNFLREKVEFSFKTAKLAALAGKGFSMKISAPDGKICKEFKADSAKYLLNFPRTMPAGTYRATLYKGTEAVNSSEFFYPGIGEWEKLSFDTTRIIPPFTPITYQQESNGITASLYGRNYRWQNSFFPAQINALKEDLLLEPIVLSGNGKSIIPAKFTVKSSKPHRMDFIAAGGNDDLSAEVDGFLEYDGTQFNRVRLTAARQLKTLTLSIRMPENMATFIHASANTAAWGNKLTDWVKNGKKEMKFYPSIWLGMQEKGLSFFAESRYFWNSPVDESYILEKKDGAVILTVNLGKDVKPGKVMEVEFGFIATPVRPLSKNYPLDLFSSRHAVPLNQHGRIPTVETILISGGNLGAPFGDLPTPAESIAVKSRKQAVQDTIANGGIPVSYICNCFISTEYPEMTAYYKEWAVEPHWVQDYTSGGVKYLMYDCCPVSSSADFYLWKCASMLKQLPYGGIYFDFGVVVQCNNHQHGCYQRVPIMAMREFYRKLMLLQLDLGIKDPKIVLHNTDYLRMPEMSFVTHLFNGEHIRQGSSSIMHNGKDILDTYELPMFAGELSSMPFGVTNSAYFPNDVLSKQYGGGKEPGQLYVFRVTKAALAGTLIHNTIISAHRSHYGLINKIVRIYDKFGVPASEFNGYWRNYARVSGAEDIYVSFYQKPGEKKILAVIAHAGKAHADQSFTVSFDPGKLGFTPDRAVDLLNAPDPEYESLIQMIKDKKLPHFRTPTDLGDFGVSGVKIVNGKVQLSLKHHSFALLEISGK